MNIPIEHSIICSLQHTINFKCFEGEKIFVYYIIIIQNTGITKILVVHNYKVRRSCLLQIVRVSLKSRFALKLKRQFYCSTFSF